MAVFTELSLLKSCFHFVVILLHLNHADENTHVPRTVLKIFSRPGLVAHGTVEREKGYDTPLLLFTGELQHTLLWRALFGAGNGKTWPLYQARGGAFLMKIHLEVVTLSMKRVAAQFIRAHLLLSIPAFAWKMDCPCPHLPAG